MDPFRALDFLPGPVLRKNSREPSGTEYRGLTHEGAM